MIEADGWFLVRTKGSHHHFHHPTKKGTVTIPHPRHELGFLINDIKKQAGLK
ncbi:type II toxin-antitoxin system HicA family toxin [Pasteurellaceae bacterium USgator11]|nr:type II toxin-antitoxin system HicA family toxin [Pasteurellaceae bacterium USgator41]TNG96462.1 type II toxin-antitoxin system HicA family toxin [Pasteurellaceae bacterium UScroc12]TNH00456.1 type II toxin-antitoxin system HicA family toxin [Pasteurellaceae bacterium UScroc31]TNH01713.1 type II toxin-antitoxin system HicA family toxin [Pasteurellaceae bacterium USgator11]